MGTKLDKMKAAAKAKPPAASDETLVPAAEGYAPRHPDRPGPPGRATFAPATDKGPRKCCGTTPGDTPHAVGCVNHPDTPRKPAKAKPATSPAGFDREEEQSGRWPSGTKLVAEWTGDEWILNVMFPADENVRATAGSGIHKLLSKAYRDWLAVRGPNLSSEKVAGNDV